MNFIFMNRYADYVKKVSQLIFVIMLFSICSLIFFEPVHAIHHCNEEECPVCLLISIIKNQLKTIIPAGLGEPVSVNLQILYFFIAFCSISIADSSLIKQKVRLNN